MNTLALAASGYAHTLSWPVFPLRPRSKIPEGSLVPHGVKDATTDAATIRKWWAASPSSNVGLACGFSFFVLDVDPRSGGDETLGRLVRQHGQLPHTPTAVTGGGGQHWLFAWPQDQILKAAGSIGDGLDVKGPGGYIVAPPSVHPSGGQYFWELNSLPSETPIAQAPDWLTRLVFRRAKTLGTAKGPAARSFLALAWDMCGWLGADIDDTRVMAACPWQHEHSDGRGAGTDDSCVIFAPTERYPLGRFHCSHGHCAHRGPREALRELPTPALRVLSKTFPDLFEIALAVMAGAKRVA